jgi:hypothetical protein
MTRKMKKRKAPRVMRRAHQVSGLSKATIEMMMPAIRIAMAIIVNRFATGLKNSVVLYQAVLYRASWTLILLELKLITFLQD